MTTLDSRWQDIDPWWESYVQEQQSDLVELQDVLAELNDIWEQSESIFDQDPLSQTRGGTDKHSGPLRPNQEENWSHWLAHLVRSSSGDFNRALFGPTFQDAPRSVRRERHFHDAEKHDRRVDVLIEAPERGISIEVKKGDENFEKTPETAALTEIHHDRNLDWTHYLLLPKSKVGVLRDTFGEYLDESNEVRPQIAAECTANGAIDVMYWRDVSRALRRTLVNGDERAPQWEASAYLFILMIEQQICRFTAPSGVIKHDDREISGIQVIQSIDLGDQIDYLRAAIGVMENE